MQSGVSDKQAEAVHATIAPDLLTASITIDTLIAPRGVTPADVLARLQAIGVQGATADSLATLLNPDGLIVAHDPVIVARGVAPVASSPGEATLLDPPAHAAATPPGQSVSHYDHNHVPTFVPGDAVARLSPPRAPQPGRDVLGRPLPVPAAHEKPITLGANVRLDDTDPTIVRATAAGKVVLNHRVLAVESVLETPADVDFSTGNIDFAGDVIVNGKVTDLFKVHAAGTISVRGAVEAADIAAGADLRIRGGVAGRGKAVILARRDLSARYLTHATVRVGGSILVEREIAGCHVIATGLVVVERGPIIGGHITTPTGIRCESIGSPAAVATLIEAGIDQTLRDLAAASIPALLAKLKQAQHVRDTLNPLLANPKRLTAAQKEKATELLYEADECETAARKTLTELQTRHDQAAEKAAKAAVIVSHQVFAGVVLRFPGLESVFSADVKGAHKALVRTIDHERTICLVNLSSGSTRRLPSRPYLDPNLDALHRTLASHKPADLAAA